MLGQPLLHGWMLVGGIVVGDQVQRLALGRLAVDLAQELQPLSVCVPLLALADDLASNTFSAANRVVVPWRL